MDRKEMKVGRLILEQIEADAHFAERIRLAVEGSRRYWRGNAKTRQLNLGLEGPATPEGAAGKSRETAHDGPGNATACTQNRIGRAKRVRCDRHQRSPA